MLIHGLADDNVVVAHTLRLSGALLAAGYPHTVLPLSGITHMASQETVAENLLLLQLDFLRSALFMACRGRYPWIVARLRSCVAPLEGELTVGAGPERPGFHHCGYVERAVDVRVRQVLSPGTCSYRISGPTRPGSMTSSSRSGSPW